MNEWGERGRSRTDKRAGRREKHMKGRRRARDRDEREKWSWRGQRGRGGGRGKGGHVEGKRAGVRRKIGERDRAEREEKWSGEGVCNYGGGGEERECMRVCNVMKERTEQEEVGAGREEGGEGGEERGAVRGGGRVGERRREVKEVGGGRGATQEGREGESEQKHRGVGGTECSGEREERGR